MLVFWKSIILEDTNGDNFLVFIHNKEPKEPGLDYVIDNADIPIRVEDGEIIDWMTRLPRRKRRSGKTVIT